MVTYFNKKDLVNFGKYLLSEKRTESVLVGVDELNLDPENGDYLDIAQQRIRQVSHADVENFLESIKKVD